MKTWTPDGVARNIAQRYAVEMADLFSAMKVQKHRHHVDVGRALDLPGLPPAEEIDDLSHHIARLRAISQPGVIVSVGLTHDLGTHASGWWRNSDYDECLHLSLCGIAPGEWADLDDVEIRGWARAVFGSDLHKTWTEPPAAEGDAHRTYPTSRRTTHVRLYLDREGQPIIPRDEVYTLRPWDDGTSPEKVFRS